jgi:ubiquinone/menaquinone biosynthesis C-methylase UbiE
LAYNDDVINDIVLFIQTHIKINTIADVGSGTGILTQQLLKFKFSKYYSVEPNESMQKYAILNDKKKMINHINATSCETKLPNSCVDVIFVGTALHWFEPKQTLIEFKRILKDNGFLVILFGGFAGEIAGELGEETNKLIKLYGVKKGIKIKEIKESKEQAPKSSTKKPSKASTKKPPKKTSTKKTSTKKTSAEPPKEIPKEAPKIKKYDQTMKNYSNNFYTIISRNNIKLTMDQFIGFQLSISSSPTSEDANYEKFIAGLKVIFNKYASTDNKLHILNRTTALISNKLL